MAGHWHSSQNQTWHQHHTMQHASVAHTWPVVEVAAAADNRLDLDQVGAGLDSDRHTVYKVAGDVQRHVGVASEVALGLLQLDSFLVDNEQGIPREGQRDRGLKGMGSEGVLLASSQVDMILVDTTSFQFQSLENA